MRLSSHRAGGESSPRHFAVVPRISARVLRFHELHCECVAGRTAFQARKCGGGTSADDRSIWNRGGHGLCGVLGRERGHADYVRMLYNTNINIVHPFNQLNSKTPANIGHHFKLTFWVYFSLSFEAHNIRHLTFERTEFAYSFVTDHSIVDKGFNISVEAFKQPKGTFAYFENIFDLFLHRMPLSFFTPFHSQWHFPPRGEFIWFENVRVHGLLLADQSSRGTNRICLNSFLD